MSTINDEHNWHKEYGCNGFWQFAATWDEIYDTLYRHCRICGRVEMCSWDNDSMLKEWRDARKIAPGSLEAPSGRRNDSSRTD